MEVFEKGTLNPTRRIADFGRFKLIFFDGVLEGYPTSVSLINFVVGLDLVRCGFVVVILIFYARHKIKLKKINNSHPPLARLKTLYRHVHP